MSPTESLAYVGGEVGGAADHSLLDTGYSVTAPSCSFVHLSSADLFIQLMQTAKLMVSEFLATTSLQ